MSEPKVEVVLVNEGRPYEHRPRRFGDRKIVQIDRVWNVLVDGELAGKVEYHLITRETRSKGKRYVNSRWQTPGWGWKTVEPGKDYRYIGRFMEGTSRKACVERIVREYNRSRQELP